MHVNSLEMDSYKTGQKNAESVKINSSINNRWIQQDSACHNFLQTKPAGSQSTKGELGPNQH